MSFTSPPPILMMNLNFCMRWCDAIAKIFPHSIFREGKLNTSYWNEATHITLTLSITWTQFLFCVHRACEKKAHQFSAVDFRLHVYAHCHLVVIQMQYINNRTKQSHKKIASSISLSRARNSNDRQRWNEEEMSERWNKKSAYSALYALRKNAKKYANNVFNAWYTSGEVFVFKFKEETN